MNSTLFERIARTEKRRAHRGESQFDYLNLSGRDEAALVRSLLEDWLSRFPAAARSKLRARLRNKNNAVFAAAFFELYLHELLHRHGYDCEPDFPVQGVGGKNVDFKVIPADGSPSFLLEAIVPGLNGPRATAQARIDAIYNVIDAKLHSPNFFVAIDEAEAKPKTAIPVAAICRQIEAQMARLDPALFAAGQRGVPRVSGPLWRANAGGWSVTYSLIPKSPAARGRPGLRPIGSIARNLDHKELLSTVRAAVKTKASRYGRPSMPYVVAINAIACRWALPSLDVQDGKEALYGSEIIVCSRELPKPRLDRARDGAFLGPSGPIYTRVSAVLLVSALTPWSVASQDPVLYHHPWAEYPGEFMLGRLPSVFRPPTPSLYAPGCDATELFGLPPGWPRAREA